MSHPAAIATTSNSTPPPRFAAWLIAGVSLFAVLMMAHHPTVATHDMAGAAAELVREAMLNRIVHGGLIVLLALLLLGFGEFSSWLAARAPQAAALTRAAQLSYGIGTFAMIAAATFSGFVATGLAAHYLGSDTAGLESLRQSLASSHAINQASAAIGLVAQCVAILLWSIALLRASGRRLVFVLGLVAAAPALALMFGLLNLNVHGAMLALLLQVIWNLALAWTLLRRGWWIEQADKR